MQSDKLGFFTRLWLAVVLFWKILFNGSLALRLRQAAERQPLPEADATPALQLLAIMQREGRFVDFLQEDVSRYSDAEIGAAARVVHQGCGRGLREYLELEPIRTEAEGAAVMLERGFDPAQVRVTGNVLGEPPFRGRLAHHGWQVTKIHLPELSDGHPVHVVAPAEVELS